MAAPGPAQVKREATLVMAKPEVEVIWAAGFFDGEGWISVNKQPSGNYLRMAVAGTQESAVRRFQAATGGLGRINGPYQFRAQDNPVSYWRASSAEARAVVALIAPYLCEHSHEKIRRAEEGCSHR